MFNEVVKDGENEGYCVKCEIKGAKNFSDQLFQALGEDTKRLYPLLISILRLWCCSVVNPVVNRSNTQYTHHNHPSLVFWTR